MENKIKKFFKKLFIILKKEEMRILPGNIAFFLVFSIIPIITLFVFLGSLFNFDTIELINFFNNNFPKSISNILVPAFTSETVNFSLIIILVLSLYVASNGAHSIIISSNKLYKINDKSYIKERIKAIYLIILILLLLIFMFILPIFGNNIINFIGKFLNNNVFLLIETIFNILKFPISLLFIYIIVKLIYTIAPSKKLKSSDMTKGSIFTTISWVLASILFSFYLTHFANYSRVYGNLSNIIVLILYIYILSYIFVVGLSLNALKYELNNEIEKTDRIKIIKLKD